jgi:hypothetical protein
MDRFQDRERLGSAVTPGCGSRRSLPFLYSLPQGSQNYSNDNDQDNSKRTK